MRRRLRNRFGFRVSNHLSIAKLAIRGDLGVGRVRAVAFAVSGGAVPLFQGGGPEITMTTTAAVTAGRVVEVSGDRSIRHAQSASLKRIGVAKQTGDAVGDKLGVATSGVWMLTAKGAINAGDAVMASADNNGTVAAIPAVDPASLATLATGVTNTRARVGHALAAAADGAPVPVLVEIG